MSCTYRLRLRSARAGLPALLALTLLAGCSLPGMSFHGRHAPLPGTVGKGAKFGAYVVQRITPKLLVALARAERHPARGAPNPKLQAAIRRYSYHVAAHDVLRIMLWGDPAFASSGAIGPSLGAVPSVGVSATGSGSRLGTSGVDFTVHSNGKIFFPYVGAVAVAGLTTTEIRAHLGKALEAYLKHPQVSVNVVGFHSQFYQLSGVVRKPGLYPITTAPITVAQAIQAAGGVLRTLPNALIRGNVIPRSVANLAQVVYIHAGRREILNLRAFFADGDQRENRLLRPGDIVDVPDNAFDQVHLIGEVRTPGNYALDAGRLNLAQVLGDAGGINLRTANPARIFIFRGAFRKPQVFWLNARSPLAMLLATRFPLRPQDVVFVATSPLGAWNRVISQILPTVQALYETKVLIHP
jgi:polysaccharide export outer membrane protein